MLVLYFSGTGNTKFLAQLFADKTNATCISIEEQLDFTLAIATNEIIAFCYPIYGSRLPRNMREFVLAHKTALNGKRIIIFCTQMYFSGDGARALTDSIFDISHEVIYAEHFNMPNNINNFFLFPVTSLETNLKCIPKIKRKVDKVCNDIENGIVVKRGFNTYSKWLGLIQGAFSPKLENIFKTSVWIDKNCTNCKLCIDCCPMENFKSEQNHIVPQGNCVACYRCINICPQKAIAVWFKKKVRKQYKGIQ